LDAASAVHEPSAGIPYLHLTERAVDYVRDHGGCVTEDALIAFVFGNGGTSSLWQSLLREILNQDDRLILRPDGNWSLAVQPPQSGAGPLTDFVAIDVETTGLQPLRQRVIEIALIRFEGGQIADRFSTLVNPDRRIPAFISKLTGIDNTLVDDAPPFAEIAETVETFIDGGLLVGHNVGFDINFLNAELSRCGRRQLVNERLDVMGLAARLIPGLRRPNLDKAALQLGLTPRKIHRAEVDAELAATVALHLAARANDLGIDTVDRLRAIGRPASFPVGDGKTRGSSYLDRSILASIPKRPGVYLMRDRHGTIIYVGKAKNLRDRVATYFSQPLGYTRKMDGLIESVAKIDVEETGSELAALLLESQLIRRYQPRYNVVMRASEQYPYIRVDIANPWPRVTMSKARKDDGAVYLGPFKNRRSVQIAIDLVNNHFPLRTCSRTFKNARSYGSPCIQLDLGKCLGPCVGRADRDEYMRYTREVVAFLGGESELMLDRLHQQLESSALTLDFERARQLRNSIQLLQSLIGSHVRLKRAVRPEASIVVQPGVELASRAVMLVVRGRIWSSTSITQQTEPEDLSTRLASSWSRYVENGMAEIDHQTLDDVIILSRWMDRATGSPCIIPLDHEIGIDWPEVARLILGLTDEMHVPALADSLLDDAIDDRQEHPPAEFVVELAVQFNATAAESTPSYP
jgi:DNA polymerase III epsilon subunit family exonuclease